MCRQSCCHFSTGLAAAFRGSGHLLARPFTLFPSRNQPSSLAASLFRLFSQGTSVLSSSARTYHVSSRQAIYLISSRVTAVLARPEHLPTGQDSRWRERSMTLARPFQRTEGWGGRWVNPGEQRSRDNAFDDCKFVKTTAATRRKNVSSISS